MGSNFDPAEITDFLRGHRTSAYAHGRPAYNHYSVEYNDDQQPRWAPPVTAAHAVALLDEDDDGEAYFNDDAHSEFTVTSAVTSHPCTVRSAAAPSIFSHEEDDDADFDLRSVSQSTAPSTTGPYTGPSFVQQFFGAGASSHHLGPAATPQPGQSLWCEYSDLLECAAVFHLDDEAAWIEHHAAHLRNTFPRRLMCWFCDPARHQDAPPWFEAASAHPRDARANFVARMRHVREHIVWDPVLWTSAHMRPDFHVVTHLREKGVLSQAEFEHAMAYDELPERYRLPGWRSHAQAQAQSASHRSLDTGTREKGQFHDLEKERRAERRRMKERPHQHQGGGGGGGGSKKRR